MMKNIDYNIYNKMGDKALTEIYLGSVSYPWKYSKALYTADCTEAIPLLVFESVICGLLSIEAEGMRLNQVADVLGLNIKNEPDNLIFRDNAEYEILIENLCTLRDYGMIQSDDDSFSYFSLTEIGKEYYSKRRKFKTGQRKSFSIYYDLETSNHQKAKDVFYNILSSTEYHIAEGAPKELAEEKYIKEFAECQIPSIYDNKTGCSFTNLMCQKYTEMSVNIVFGILYDIATKTIKVISHGLGMHNEYFQSAVENNQELKQRIVNIYLAEQKNINGKQCCEEQEDFESDLINLQRDIDYQLYLNNKENALNIGKEYFATAGLFEEGKIYSILKDEILRSKYNVLYITIPTMEEYDYNCINELAKNIDTDINLLAGKNSCITKLSKNINVVLCDVNEKSYIINNTLITPTYLNFVIEGSNVSINVYKRQFNNASENINTIKRKIAVEYLPKLIEEYLSTTELECIDKEKPYEAIEKINTIRNKIDKFDDFIDELEYREAVNEADIKKFNVVIQLKNLIINKLSDDFEKISNRDIEELDDIKEINNIKGEVTVFEKDLFNINDDFMTIDNSDENVEQYNALVEKFGTYKKRISDKEMYLKRQILPKDYVIDSKVFIICPKILDYIKSKNKIILSRKVFDEIDELKTKLNIVGELKKNIRTATREINQFINLKRVIYEKENLNNLPQEYQKYSYETATLSIANKLKIADRNVIIVTTDSSLIAMATSLEIPFISVNELAPSSAIFEYSKFKKNNSDNSKTHGGIKKQVRKENSNEPINNKKEGKMPQELYDLLLQAYNECKTEGYKNITVAMFNSTLKRLNPSFTILDYGFNKFKNLCEAYPKQIFLFENEKKALCIKLNENGAKSNRPKNIESFADLSDESKEYLKKLVLEMIGNEDKSEPVKDGDIRRRFQNESGVKINLLPVIDVRRQFSIPNSNERKINKQ